VFSPCGISVLLILLMFLSSAPASPTPVAAPTPAAAAPTPAAAPNSAVSAS
jgi:hypothetical protein